MTSKIIIDPDNDLTLDDILSIEQADEALNGLDQAIMTIKVQLSDTERVNTDPTWAFGAKHALQAKRVARQALQRKRGQLRRGHQGNRQERFIKRVRELNPMLFEQVAKEMSA